MKRQKISECIGGMDEKYIGEANTFTYAGRRMGWKKWAAIAACLAAVGIAVILGIAAMQPRDYTLRHEGNYTYLRISEEKLENVGNPPGLGMEIEPYLSGSSFQELKRKLETGDFSDYELYLLSRFEKNENGEIMMPNIEQLFAPILPSDTTISQITLKSRSYSFKFRSESSEGAWSWIYYADNDMFYRVLEYEYDCCIGDQNDNWYEIQLENGTMYVAENYVYIDQLKLSSIDVFAETNIGNFRLYNASPTDLPTEEYLAQFGIKPFEE